MSGILFLMMMGGALPLIFVDAFAGVFLYYMFSFMNPHRIVWGGFDVAWAKIIAVTTLVVFLFSKERKNLNLNSTGWLIVLFFIWTTITTMDAMFPKAAWIVWVEYGKVILMTMVVVLMVRDRLRIHCLVWLIVLSVGYWTVKGGLWVVMTGSTGRVMGPPQSAYYDRNALACYGAMMIPLIHYLIIHSAHRFTRLAMMAFGFLNVIAIIGTNSRGGFLTLGALAVMYWWNSRRKITMLVIPLALGATIFAAIPQERLGAYFQRTETIQSYEEDSSAMGRLEIWAWSLERAKEMPFLGGGFEMHHSYVGEHGRKRPAHSVWFQVLQQHSWTGLALFLLMGLSGYRSANRVRKLAGKNPDIYWARDLCTACRLSFVAFAVGGTFINIAYAEMLYAILVLTILAENVVRQNQAERSQAESTDAVKSQSPPWLQPQPVRSAHR